MGKIFNALEKSKKEHKTSASQLKVHSLPIKDEPKKKPPPLDTQTPQNRVGTVDRNLIALIKPQSFESEQFKQLRTNLLFPASGKSPRSIMVTSAVPGEGKSFVSSNLAISIAQNIDEHVLLMDCDMRMPSIHRNFGQDNVNGLSEYLSNQASLSSLLRKTPIKKLTILPGGKPPHNPSELLSSQQMTKLLEEVKTRYKDRYIVIDSPPPILTAETSAISRHVDGVVLVVRYGRTSRKLVEELIQLLGKEKILGVVFNRFELPLISYYGYGKYGKYGKYYKKH